MITTTVQPRAPRGPDACLLAAILLGFALATVWGGMTGRAQAAPVNGWRIEMQACSRTTCAPSRVLPLVWDARDDCRRSTSTLQRSVSEIPASLFGLPPGEPGAVAFICIPDRSA